MSHFTQQEGDPTTTRRRLSVLEKGEKTSHLILHAYNNAQRVCCYKIVRIVYADEPYSHACVVSLSTRYTHTTSHLLHP